MQAMQKVLILINKISDQPTEDELDVLSQASEVEVALKELGYSSERVFMDLDLMALEKRILQSKPSLVFNLVESIDKRAELIYMAPALLESLHIQYTGCPVNGMFLTSNKVLTKQVLQRTAIRTPGWYDVSKAFIPDPEKLYIAKPLWEDASVGITDRSVFKGSDSNILSDFSKQWGKKFFIEEFIDGREFNISILGGKNGPEVMPLAEIVFDEYPENKPKIVGYEAKWDKETFEYHHTLRSFSPGNIPGSLQSELKEMTLKCWNEFNLKGYARVDFRVDKDNRPWVLEINANPCISSDAGFFAACSQAGLTFTRVVERIIEDALI